MQRAASTVAKARLQPATIKDGGEGDVDSNGVMDVPHAERMQRADGTV